MDHQTANFVAAMVRLAAVCLTGSIVGAAIQRRQFNVRTLLLITTILGVLAGIMVAMGRW
jgi:hypothetical protein